ncbi:MAG: alpha/beta hydrolase [Neomegalonema sp.]|nr:alpha/beta hydrolase [Neomegalonema sp.]
MKPHSLIKKAIASGLAAACALFLPLSAEAGPKADLTPAQSVRYHSAEIAGTEIFYREAGSTDAPTVLLLHGFPSSSHMFRNLIPQLAGSAHVIAPDYPGFGYSAAPSAKDFAYDFAHVAELIDGLTEKLGAKRYVLYMQDFGGPVGMRLALKHPERVAGIIVQNATFHAEGWNPGVVEQFSAFWQDPTGDNEKAIRGFLAPETTRWQYTQGEARTERLSPDAWTHDQSRLDRPGIDAAMLAYLYNYQDNIAQYPAWQAWLGKARPASLILWGKNDPFFTLDGVKALQGLLPEAKTEFYEAGHFALETHTPEMAAQIRDFLTRLPR